MIRSILQILLAFAFTIIVAPHAFANEKLSVFVSTVPQKYFVQKIVPKKSFDVLKYHKFSQKCE